jgi:ubiquitin C-terminal hydrolase
MALDEYTTINNNQLDHIILDKGLAKICFTTSYNNFSSDHKPIVFRLGYCQSQFRPEILIKLNFNSEHHLKTGNNEKSHEENLMNEQTNKEPTIHSNTKNQTNRQRGRNISYQIESNVKLLPFLNPGGRNLCFSNAAITCILNIPILRRFLIDDRLLSVDENRNALLVELSHLANIPNNETNISTTHIRNIVQSKCFEVAQMGKCFNDNNQHDCVEFIQSLLEHLWNEDEVPLDLKENIFGGLSQEVLTCRCGHVEELSIQNLPEILPIPLEGENIQMCIEKYFSSEIIEWRCPICPRSKVMKTVKIIKEPETLVLQILRFEYKIDDKNVMKKHDPLVFPIHLNFRRNSLYTLSTVVNHLGDYPQSGHYTSLIYDETSNEFILIDDDSIHTDFQLDKDLLEISYIVTYIKNT